MRKSSIVGYLGLAVLSVATFRVTNYALSGVLRAQPPGQSGQKADAAVPRYSSDTRHRDALDKGGPDVFAADVLRKGWAAGRVEVTGLAEVPGGIAVEAAAKLSNGIEDRRFVWAFTVRSRDGSETIWKQRYDQQIGLSRVGTIARPTFREAVALPPGEYLVSVSIQEVPPVGVKALDDPDLAKSMTMTGDDQYIIVH